MDTGKSDDELIHLDNKMRIWTRSGKFRIVSGLVEHVFECSVIVVGVRRREFIGEERRRVQELHVGLD